MGKLAADHKARLEKLWTREYNYHRVHHITPLHIEWASFSSTIDCD